jgi:hypothetical protein
MVSAPVGMRCRDCARQNSPIDHATPALYVRAGVAALIAAMALGWMASLVFWLGAAHGYLVAEVALRAGGRRRGVGMQAIVGIAAFIGAVAWRLPGFEQGRPILMPGLVQILTHPYSLVAIGLSLFFAVVHVRNI